MRTNLGLGIAALLLALVGQGAAAREGSSSGQDVAGLEARLAATPADQTLMQDLAHALLADVRAGGSAQQLAHAESLVDRLLAAHAPRADALDAWRLLIAHRFDDALAAARRARAAGDEELLAVASEADALTELGRYDEAEAVVQQLLDRHYGIAALARASHLRFLFGDLDGALELARSALADSRPGIDRAWLQLDLADLELAAGAPELALQLATEAVAELPAPALAMQARAQLVNGDRYAALALYRVATDKVLRADTLLEVWRLARELDERKQANKSGALLAALARLDLASGGRDRRSFVEYQLDNDDLASAEALARAEWQGRPDVYGAAQLAWVLHRAGKHDEARAYAARAVREGTPDPLLQWRAGTVLAAAGEARGEALVAAAHARNPRLGSAPPALAARP